MNNSFWKAGHHPTLLASFLMFDISFCVWVMLGPLAIQIAADLGLTPAQKGLMVATPVLAGAVLRVAMGILVDRIKPRRAGVLGQLLVIGAIALAWLAGVQSFQEVLVLGCFLGVAGASFAVALPLASRWYPPEHQGKALGLAGAGNSGTTLSALFMPTLATWYGWNNVFGLVLIPLVAVFALYVFLAKDSPAAPSPRTLAQYLTVLGDRDTWWFMFFYSVTFGGFVGLAASLTLYCHDQYGLSAVHAGYFTAACVFAGSLVRPLGGTVADHLGGIRVLTGVYLVAGIGLVIVSFGMPSAWSALPIFGVIMLVNGVGNGAVFQLVPQRFSEEIGILTGLVGSAGGIGGFCLAASLGYSKQLTGGYQTGFLIFAALTLAALASIAGVKARWRTTWGAAGLAGARV
jgi:MFS transporter, NNP family, nitrate/nitrite transporter